MLLHSVTGHRTLHAYPTEDHNVHVDRRGVSESQLIIGCVPNKYYAASCVIVEEGVSKARWSNEVCHSPSRAGTAPRRRGAPRRASAASGRWCATGPPATAVRPGCPTLQAFVVFRLIPRSRKTPSRCNVSVSSSPSSRLSRPPRSAGPTRGGAGAARPCLGIGGPLIGGLELPPPRPAGPSAGR